MSLAEVAWANAEKNPASLLAFVNLGECSRVPPMTRCMAVATISFVSTA
jgi:hypothetical protein